MDTRSTTASNVRRDATRDLGNRLSALASALWQAHYNLDREDAAELAAMIKTLERYVAAIFPKPKKPPRAGRTYPRGYGLPRPSAD